MSKPFPTNEHAAERIVRVLAGVAILSLAFVGPKTGWGYLGAIPLLTGATGSCPLYTRRGLCTCPMKKA